MWPGLVWSGLVNEIGPTEIDDQSACRMCLWTFFYDFPVSNNSWSPARSALHQTNTTHTYLMCHSHRIIIIIINIIVAALNSTHNSRHWIGWEVCSCKHESQKKKKKNCGLRRKPEWIEFMFLAGTMTSSVETTSPLARSRQYIISHELWMITRDNCFQHHIQFLPLDRMGSLLI